MEDAFDLLVIGSGSAATGVAVPCAEAGWRVALAEERPFGGTCALRGCDPKNVLVSVAETAVRARRLEGYGLGAPPAIRWSDLMDFKRSFTDPIPPQKERQFREAGIEPLHGTARFIDAHTVYVNDQEIRADRVLIATGSRPADLPIEGAELLTTSDTFLDLETLPRRIAFIGGGYISMEFAHLARAAGAEVTVVHRGAHVLAEFEPELADRLAAHARAGGITFHLNTQATGIERVGEKFVLYAETEGGSPLVVEADLVVHGAGRVPNIDGLKLDSAGIFHGREGISVTEHLQSVSQAHVYAVGDCAASGGAPLTPAAGHEAAVAAENLLHGNRRAVDMAATPSVAFTMPPLASVGLTETDARERGHDIDVKRGDMAQWLTYRRQREEAAAYKVVLEAGSGCILGAHLLGEGAGETINLFALAMRHGLNADALREVLWAYPTHASGLPSML